MTIAPDGATDSALREKCVDQRLILVVDPALIIDVLTNLADGRNARDGRRKLGDLLGIGMRADRDHRIVAALHRMRDQPDKSHSLAELGKFAGLSESRFLHLFKAETGVPLRRYRLWSRMGAAVGAVRDGASLTDAAQAAGFASSAHLSTAFRDMFGMMPSELVKALEPIRR